MLHVVIQLNHIKRHCTIALRERHLTVVAFMVSLVLASRF